MSELEYRVIKSDGDYEVALHEAERLVASDPTPGTASAERLELLTVLIEDYEKRLFSFDSPDPIQAIEFRMEEQGLKQKDLVPLLGSRSRVSEVLSRKRPLTVGMIRALSVGLGIPADVLVGSRPEHPTRLAVPANELEWSRFPIGEMSKRGWFNFVQRGGRKPSTKELVKTFFDCITAAPAFALYRRKFRGEGLSDESRYSVLAWTARVLMRAKQEDRAPVRFQPERINTELLRQVARLSSLEGGPKVAVEFLAKRGIAVVIEPPLPRTMLDGVALLSEQGQAVIGLTLRYDRLDAFWFTLMHELVHVWKHLASPDEAFVDRIERTEPNDPREREANRVARDAFIPRAIWRRNKAFLAPTRGSIRSLADELSISPAIIVGRLHFETGNYRTFNDLVGSGSVRRMFSENGDSRW